MRLVKPLKNPALHRFDRPLELEVKVLRRAVGQVAAQAATHAVALDRDGAFPIEDINALATAGALRAPLPRAFGGLGLGTTSEGASPLMEILRLLGHANLSLGRLYEGHVNALSLIVGYGTPAQIMAAADDAAAGLLFGVWNTEGSDGVVIERTSLGLLLRGRKRFASGAGFIRRPLITARAEGNSLLMVLPKLAENTISDRADLSDWQAQGMSASATGVFDFTGIDTRSDDIIGSDGDYHRQPHFSAGAWRFAAVQLGGIDRLFEEGRFHLATSGRIHDPHQQSRMGQALIAAETAHLFVRSAADLAEKAEAKPERAVAYVNLARLAVERAALDVMEAVHRSVGLAGFMRSHPIERLTRDLATYLRQPAPDQALTAAAAYALPLATPLSELWQ